VPMLRSTVTAAVRRGARQSTFLAVVWLGALGTANAQNDLPAGPNHDLVTRTCAACHGLSQVVAGQGATREDWASIINEMISYGADIDTVDQAKILEYLSTTLGPNSNQK
jgi:cytochrome c5